MRFPPAVILAVFSLIPATACAAPTELADVLLREFRMAAGVTGMGAAVIDGQGRMWQGQSGMADVQAKLPVTPHTEFRLASVSKFVTTEILANLVDRKLIDLSLPVHAYLPDYPKKAHPLTSFHLATHTSGTPHYQMPQDIAIDDRVTPYASVTEATGIFRDRPLQNVPGTTYLYSSFGFNLLSAVMEKAAGKAFPQLLAELGKRAGAASLQVEYLGTPGKHWSRLYDTDGDEIKRGNITYGWAGGSMLANPGDLARVALQVLDPTYISTPTLDRMSLPARYADGRVITAERFTMATGWRLSADGAGRTYLHHSGTMRGARSHVAVYPRERVAVALLSNTNFVSAMDGTGEALAEAVTGVAGSSPCRSGSQTFKGRYQDKALEGKIVLGERDGLCTWTLSVDNYFGEKMLNGRKLQQLVGYSRAGDGAVYLVTPIGIFPGKAGAGSLDFSLLGRTASFTF